MGTRGQTEWSEQLFRKHYHDLFRSLVMFAMRFVDSLEQSEDIVQDVFSFVLENRVSMDDEVSFRSYLYNSVHHKALDRLKHNSVVDKYAKTVRKSSKGAAYQGVDDDIFTEEVFRRLFIYIDQLPARQREIFKLNMEGKKLREIAEQLEISYESVKTQRQRAVKSLRDKLSSDELLLLLFILG